MVDEGMEIPEWGCIVLIALVVLCVTAYEITKLLVGK